MEKEHHDEYLFCFQKICCLEVSRMEHCLWHHHQPLTGDPRGVSPRTNMCYNPLNNSAREKHSYLVKARHSRGTGRPIACVRPGTQYTSKPGRLWPNGLCEAGWCCG